MSVSVNELNSGKELSPAEKPEWRNDQSSEWCLLPFLPNECLLLVFSYLTKKELIGIERVCERWRALSQGCWLKVREINFKEDFGSNLEDDHITIVLRKCKFLKALHLSGFRESTNSFKLSTIIGKNCQELKHLTTTGLNLKHGVCEGFLDAIRFLVTLEMHDAWQLTDDELTPILAWLINLEKLIVNDAWMLNGSSLGFLNKRIKHLDLRGCARLSVEEIDEVLKNLTNLEVLIIKMDYSPSSFRCPPFKIYIKSLRASCQSLKILHFYDALLHGDVAVDKISFPNLKDLELLYDEKVNCSKMLSYLINACPNLEFLGISHCNPPKNSFYRINDEVILAIANLRKLASLHLSGDTLISSRSLALLAENLKSGEFHTFSCQFCTQITDMGPGILIALCPNLTVLKLGGCENITMGLVRTALPSLMKRTNDKPLQIFLNVSGKKRREYRNNGRLVLRVVWT